MPRLLSNYGELNTFNPESENITTYLERVELYFMANSVPEGKQVPALLMSIGPKNYSIIQGLVAPDTPKEKTFDELVVVLKSHFQPKPLVIAERFKFYRREQGPTESVLEFSAALRHLAITCDFGAFLDQALRNCFVCGLRSEPIQRSLLPEAMLSTARAVEMAQAKESASRGAKDFKGPGVTGVCHLSGQGTTGSSHTTQACHRCGRSDHSGPECKFRQAKCHKCGKQGHIAPVCKSGKPAGRVQPATGRGRGGRGRRIRQVGTGHRYEETDRDEVGAFALSLGNIDKASKPIRVQFSLSGKPVTMELDTGAAVSVMPVATFRQLFPGVTPRPLNLVLETYTGQAMKVIGESTVDVQYEDQAVQQLDLVVVKSGGPSLLGQNWLQHLRLDWKTIGSVTRGESLASLLDHYSSVFSEELGTIHPFTAHL